ncbi:thioredoxin family protein [Paraburkholderia bannensis]|uniref:thioredoxin family protein n=1 Tax=Paraburkholderia bannensis TaxID=765414 RepID=UPI002AB7AACD|nr:thioredoxin family protein [Paraburkholderia bannensis]
MSVLDPWLDAAAIAGSLKTPSSRLIVLLGAQSWCMKCRELRPLFEAAAHEVPQDAWLWLDLEEHAEFIGDFLPEDMPLLLVYRAGALVHAVIASQAELHDVMRGRSDSSLANSTHIAPAAPTDLIARLALEDWGKQSA